MLSNDDYVVDMYLNIPAYLLSQTVLHAPLVSGMCVF
jgi:hypothetical protein